MTYEPHKMSIDPASRSMLLEAERSGIETAWDRFEKQQPQCGFGQLGVCCRNCNMGPCRIDTLGEGPTKGVCGATADIIVARNLLRMIAAGAAAHADHARDAVLFLKEAAEGRTESYKIKDREKLNALASEYKISNRGEKGDVIDLAEALISEFGRQQGGINMTHRAPPVRQMLWEKLGINPRGIDREVVECLHRTHIGVDNDPLHILLHGLRTGIADGWGASMIATDVQDILFGTPAPRRSEANLGVLKEDEVNIIVHGHEPILSEMSLQRVRIVYRSMPIWCDSSRPRYTEMRYV